MFIDKNIISLEPKQKKETITRKLTNNNNPCDKKLVIMTWLGKLGQKSFYESNEDKIKRTGIFYFII